MNLSHSWTHSNSPIPHTHTHKPESDACTYAHTRAYTLCMQSETPMLVCTLHTFTLSLPVFETRTRQHSTSVSVLVSFYISCIQVVRSTLRDANFKAIFNYCLFLRKKRDVGSCSLYLKSALLLLLPLMLLVCSDAGTEWPHWSRAAKSPSINIFFIQIRSFFLIVWNFFAFSFMSGETKTCRVITLGFNTFLAKKVNLKIFIVERKNRIEKQVLCFVDL